MGYFLPFYPLNSPQNFKKMKKTPGDIIILHNCTKNYDYRIYCSWGMACDRCNCYFSFWAIFCPFTPLTAHKIKFSKKWKKHLEISLSYICVPKIMIRWCTFPEILCMTDRQRQMDGLMEKVIYKGGCPTWGVVKFLRPLFQKSVEY